MPKKFVGENSKAAAAKARKNEKADAEKAKKEKEIEDAKWQDDNKSLAKKQARKDDAERKRLEAVQKKKERDELMAAEDAQDQAIAAKKSGGSASKMTRAQIRAEAEKREAAARGAAQAKAANKAVVTSHLDQPLQENLNRVEPEAVTATNVDDAIAALSVKDEIEVDKHPEKRMKAAYEAFEKERLPQLKAENVNLRLSQLKQMLRKEWMKSPDNPLNQRLAAMRNNAS